ncbi:hypothetical protein WMF28_43990 [Sorangium sp. So ce590]|uniref:hypothetical protein n=1 Tax=Sorangium sp. So ce590 TaxID=3133317 RepID=UPI003F619925
MNASILRMHVTLGSVALLALASGCGGERRPAQPIGRTPTFESEAPYAAEPQPHAADQRRPGAAPGRAPEPGPDERGRRPTEPTEEDRTRHGAAGGLDEHELCEEISASSSVTAEDIPGGVQIVMTPSPGASTTSLDMLARRLDAHLGALRQAGQQPSEDIVTRCRLFDMARMGARGRVVEAADGLRIIFTADDAASVSILREQARQFVQSAREGQVR